MLLLQHGAGSNSPHPITASRTSKMRGRDHLPKQGMLSPHKQDEAPCSRPPNRRLSEVCLLPGGYGVHASYIYGLLESSNSSCVSAITSTSPKATVISSPLVPIHWFSCISPVSSSSSYLFRHGHRWTNAAAEQATYCLASYRVRRAKRRARSRNLQDTLDPDV